MGILESVAERFAVAGRLVTVHLLPGGNVNDTYLAVFRTAFSEERVVVQRINRRVVRLARVLRAGTGAMWTSSVTARRFDMIQAARSPSPPAAWAAPCIGKAVGAG